VLHPTGAPVHVTAPLAMGDLSWAYHGSDNTLVGCFARRPQLSIRAARRRPASFTIER
jgi:hypothetical protein